MTRASGWRPVLCATGAALGVALLGGLLTDLGSWYQQLRQPPWKPPDGWFGPAWTLIFSLTALAGVRAWHDARHRADRAWLLLLFGANALLNVAWSLLFFRLHRPDWALWEVVALWASIVLLIAVLGRFSRSAPWLLAPYLLWVSFAATLNLWIVRMNGPWTR